MGDAVSGRSIVISLLPAKGVSRSRAVDVVTKDELFHELLRGRILKRLFRYREAVARTGYLPAISRPTVTAILLRLLSRGTCRWEDEEGAAERITLARLGRLMLRWVRDAFARPGFLRAIEREIGELAGAPARDARRSRLALERTPLYLRTSLRFGLEAGGSVTHTAGVVNNLDAFAARPLVLTTVALRLIREDLELHRMPLPERFWDCKGLPTLAVGPVFRARTRKIVAGRKLSFLYQRYSLNDYSGVVLARELDLPLVLEYNSSEVWISEHWGMGLRYEKLSREVELLNLRAADVVVVVSRVLQEQLVALGIEPGKILVNPNGVDPERYSPDVDGAETRERYGFEEKTVVGFIGTFGPWHGAEVLAEAFGRLLREHPEYRDRVRLFMVGDGEAMPTVKGHLERYGVQTCAVLTGLVPQEEGPKHLAACDLLASPHVPNPDGSAFFGSPTKLFEYMAMGKGIVASDLEQIGEVLRHDDTGWLVKPGDVGDLTEGLRVLIDDPERRRRLGRAARMDAVARYTWRAHTERIIAKLRERCGGDSIRVGAEDGSRPNGDGAGRQDP
jgi:glycosyltransferase involved in cell wall biosynthesis